VDVYEVMKDEQKDGFVIGGQKEEKNMY